MEIVQQVAAVAGVLALLVGTLWWMRARGLAGPAGMRRAGTRMEVLERVQLSPQHALHLVRLLDRQLLIAVSPTGCSLLESAPAVLSRPVENGQ